MTEMFGEAWPPMSVPDLAPDDDDDEKKRNRTKLRGWVEVSPQPHSEAAAGHGVCNITDTVLPLSMRTSAGGHNEWLRHLQYEMDVVKNN